MFAVTKRLLLRPGWPEDAAALTAAIAYEAVVRNLARAPWPYSAEDAEAFLALPRPHDEPRFLIALRGDARVIGGVGLMPAADGARELGYWLTPARWGCGYATEAAQAVIEMTRHALPCERLLARCHLDNPASARVLAKLGFRETARSALFSLGRGEEVPCAELALELAPTGVVAIAA